MRHHKYQNLGFSAALSCYWPDWKPKVEDTITQEYYNDSGWPVRCQGHSSFFKTLIKMSKWHGVAVAVTVAENNVNIIYACHNSPVTIFVNIDSPDMFVEQL